jgi:tetratricopeptide (TPR) repeat protein
MAYSEFRVLEPIAHITRDVYNFAIPALHRAFDTNPVAAMPSLHAGFPMLCSLAAVHVFGRKAAWALLYTAAVALAVAYLGEHYLVDILAGWLVAAAIYFVVFRTSAFDKLSAQISVGERERPAGEPFALSLRSSLLVAALFLVAAEVIGYQKASLEAEFVPPESFIARELDGKSPVVDFYRGTLAYKNRDYAEAYALLTRAIPSIEDREMRANATYLAGRSAFEAEDYADAAGALSRLDRERLPTRDLLMLAVAYDKSGDRENRDAALATVQERAPSDPTPLYWKTRLDYEGRRIDEAAVHETIARLRSNPNHELSDSLARELEELVERH